MGRLSYMNIDDQGFAFDTGNGKSFAVNGTGLQILRGFREGWEDERIISFLSDQYAVTPNDVLRDIQDFRARLKGLAII